MTAPISDHASPAVAGAPSPSELSTAPLPLRVAAMVYDGVLLFGIAFGAVFGLLALTGWVSPLTGTRRLMLQAVIFVAIGFYFCWCWMRSGQTLALKTWNLRVADASGRNPSLARAIGRYLLAWTLIVPGLLTIALLQPSRAGSLVALAAGFVLALVPALFDRDRRLLHDRWSRTRIVRDS